MQIPISHRYALTIFDLCKENGWLGKVYEDLKDLNAIFETSPEFTDFMINPVFNHVNRVEAISNLFKKNVNEVTLKVLTFIEEKKHLNLLNEIIVNFLELYRKEHNIIKVKIISSVNLDQNQLNRICEQLNHKFQKRIEYDLVIDAGLIGGMKVMVNDTVYDFSFKTQLNRFKNKLLTSV